jgi:hypothetical protein
MLDEPPVSPHKEHRRRCQWQINETGILKQNSPRLALNCSNYTACERFCNKAKVSSADEKQDDAAWATVKF